MIKLAAILVAISSWVVVAANAHPNTVLICNHLTTGTALSASVLPNGLYSERYDTNGDGVLDLETLSAVTSVEIRGFKDVAVQHRPFPIFYIEDTDYDGTPDRIMVDKGVGGRCEDIVLYEDLHKLQGRSDVQKEGAL